MTQIGARGVASPRHARRNRGSIAEILYSITSGSRIAARFDVLLLGVAPAELGGAARAVLLHVDDEVLDGVARLAVHLRGRLIGGAEVRAHVYVRVVDDLDGLGRAQALLQLEEVARAQVVGDAGVALVRLRIE